MKIAINGFGRIGRQIFKIALDQNIKVVAINDTHGAESSAYLLQYDSVYGKYNKKVSVSGKNLLVSGKKILVLSERDPQKLPWKKLAVDCVIEATGAFRDPKEARKHIKAGASYVLITAPCKKNPADITLVPGVNHKNLRKEHKIISVASCTTNCIAPVMKVLNDNFKVKRGMLTTIHAYTNDQGLHDSSHKKVRRGRAAAVNIVPTTTGAAQSVTEVLPELLGKMRGLAVRVPVSVGSLVDVTCELQGKFTAKSVNAAFKKASQKELKGIMEYSQDPLVSTDVIGNPSSCVIDSLSTQEDGNLVKVLAWYDNEFGYSSRVIDVIKLLDKLNK